MSELKSILVHLDSSPRSAVRLALAGQLAALLGATASALYAVTSALTRYPMAMVAGADVAPLLAEVDDQRLAATRTLYARTVDAAAVPWLQGTGLPISDTVRRALYADLLLLGQRSADSDRDVDVPADFVSSVIIDSGRPALLLPHIATAPVALGRVLVAWKECRESARAVTAALPLLRRAQHVRVVSFDDGGSSAGTADLAGYLHRHGVTARMDHQPALPGEVGEQLLSLAADDRSELLVMGCYGHGRAREWVLGGATRCVLDSMTLPVLMAH